MRARRPASGWCESGEALIIAPERDRAETERALAGEPVASTLGEDLATPLCTEIALGLVRYARSRPPLVRAHPAWAADPQPAALDLALKLLLDEGFIVAKPDGTLAATPLGHATSSLMLQVSTAGRLERFLRGCATPADADDGGGGAAAHRLRPLRRVGRLGRRSADAGTLAGRLSAYDQPLADWAPLRLRALTAGACLLSGVGLGVLGLPDSAAAAQTARGTTCRACWASSPAEPPSAASRCRMWPWPPRTWQPRWRAALPLRGQAVQLAPLA